MDTLGFGYILPTAGRIRDFHPLERALAGRTKKELTDPIKSVSSFIMVDSEKCYHRNHSDEKITGFPDFFRPVKSFPLAPVRCFLNRFAYKISLRVLVFFSLFR